MTFAQVTMSAAAVSVSSTVRWNLVECVNRSMRRMYRGVRPSARQIAFAAQAARAHLGSSAV
jgi:hypothetical protein